MNLILFINILTSLVLILLDVVLSLTVSRASLSPISITILDQSPGSTLLSDLNTTDPACKQLNFCFKGNK